MEKIFTENAPQAIGPYVQASKCKGFIFTSGQLPIDPVTGEFPKGGIKEQTQQSLKNIRSILEVEGLQMSDIIKTTVFLSDIENFSCFNEIYASFFPKDAYPARSAFEVGRLPKDALVEIEAIAVKE